VRISVPVLAITILAAMFLASGTTAPAGATSPPSADQFAVDLQPDIFPANTDTSIGSITPCFSAPGGMQTSIDFDLVTGPLGIPAANAMTAYSYTLNHPGGLITSITTHTPRLIGVNPGSSLTVTTDPLPDTDGSFAVTVTDSGGAAAAESGPGVLDSLTLVVAATAPVGVYPIFITNASHTDTAAATHVPDVTLAAVIGIGTFAPCPQDVKTVSQVLTFPAQIDVFTNQLLTVDSTLHNNGVDNPAFRIIETTAAVPTGCTANGSSGTAIVSDPMNLVLSAATPHQQGFVVNCSQSGSYEIQIETCADPGGVFDFVPENDCQSGSVLFDAALGPSSDTDGDGFSDQVESMTPLCGDGRNEDNGDDGVIDDGCPGGPPQSGSFSEADFNVGTDESVPCGTTGWAADIVSGGPPDSTDKVNIVDLQTYILPIRHFGSSPGDAEFDSRWDLVPGRGVLGTWINIADLQYLVTVMPTRAPYNSIARAFSGPACTVP